METLVKSFIQIVDDFKRKPYDLLDYTKNAFDRDFLEFNVNVAELETALQGFINASFENITSTEHAISMLKTFQSVLQRDSLISDLDSKYTVIFHNYGLDLETVQKIYDKQKTAPPITRNSPPVTGDVESAWFISSTHIKHQQCLHQAKGAAAQSLALLMALPLVQNFVVIPCPLSGRASRR
jgi:dynein heavy chain